MVGNGICEHTGDLAAFDVIIANAAIEPAARALAAIKPDGVNKLLNMLEDPSCPWVSRAAISTVLADAGVAQAVGTQKPAPRA